MARQLLLSTLKKIPKNTINKYRLLYLNGRYCISDNTTNCKPNCAAVVQQIHEMYDNCIAIVLEKTKIV